MNVRLVEAGRCTQHLQKFLMQEVRLREESCRKAAPRRDALSLAATEPSYAK
jgi:hypothetical protein